MEKLINGRFLLRQFQSEDLPVFKELIRTSWNGNHVLLKSEALIRWQYQGFGANAGMHFPVLFDKDGRMIGFRGVFPVEVNVPTKTGIITTTMAVGSLYLVIPEFRGQKLGLALQQFTQECYGNYMAIGSNLGTSAPIYKKSGYLMLDQMRRYLVPFNEDYNSLLIEPNDSYKQYLWKNVGDTVEEAKLSPNELSLIWGNSPLSKMLSINKSESFWKWRYLNHPTYKYFIFGGKDEGGIVVGRICHFYKDNGVMSKKTLFRILEIIPTDEYPDSQIFSQKLHDLVCGVLSWAKANECAGAEAYLTTNVFDTILKQCGMLLNTKVNDLNIISNYEPMTISPKLTNVSIYLGEDNIIGDFNSVYMSLADADQDRPNIVHL